MQFIFIKTAYINLEELTIVDFDDARKIIVVQLKNFSSGASHIRTFCCSQQEYDTTKKLINDKLGKFLI
jgi:hypothetical protein